MIEVRWTSGERSGTADLDRAELERFTHDGRTLPETAAGHVARQLLEGIRASGDMVLRIEHPEEFRGAYAVAFSASAKTGRMGTEARALPEPSTEAERGGWDAAARLIAPEDVMEAYQLLGNVYGHEIDRPERDGRWDVADLDALRAAFDDATFHDMGSPAFCRTSCRVGLLARQHADDLAIDPLSDRARGFFRETGCTLQTARWEDGQEETVCFIAVENADISAADETLRRFLDLRHESRPAGPARR